MHALKANPYSLVINDFFAVFRLASIKIYNSNINQYWITYTDYQDDNDNNDSHAVCIVQRKNTFSQSAYDQWC